MEDQFQLNFDNSEATDSGYRKWQKSVRAAKSRVTIFEPEEDDQPELSMNGDGPPVGYERWQADQKERRSELNRRYGLIFDSPVRVSFTFLEHEVEGCIRLPETNGQSTTLRINDLNFFPEEVESVVKLAS